MRNVESVDIRKVKKAMKERDLSGAALAREVGVSRMSMSRWLRKQEAIPEGRAAQIARVLELNERSQS